MAAVFDPKEIPVSASLPRSDGDEVDPSTPDIPVEPLIEIAIINSMQDYKTIRLEPAGTVNVAPELTPSGPTVKAFLPLVIV